MKTALGLFVLAALSPAWITTSATAAPRLKASCRSQLTGMTLTAQFDSRGPALSSTLVDDALDEPETLVHLAPKSVCGAALDFARDCRVTRLEVYAGGGDYAFKCVGGIEGSIELAGDNLTFSCHGDEVPYQYHSFVDCR